MNRIATSVLLLCAPFAASAADDLKVSQLELDVRNLQREVQAQSQLIEQLRSQLARPDQVRLSVPIPAPAVSTDWIDAAKWKRMRTGMSELEAISLLGPPTSLRTENGERVLLYAVEIGSSGFLNGSVTLRDRTVTRFETPVLK